VNELATHYRTPQQSPVVRLAQPHHAWYERSSGLHASCHFAREMPETDASEPHVVRCPKYKPHMVQLRRRLAKFIRERRGPLSQRAFARKSGLGQSTIMRIENLEQNVTVDTLEQLCKAFHVDVAELFPLVQSPAVYIDLRPPMIAIHEKKPDGKPGVKKSGDQKQDDKKSEDEKSEGKK